MQGVDTALAEMLKHTFTQGQFNLLSTMMQTWDDRDEVTDEEEANLYAQFRNNFALGGAVAAIIHLSEKNANNDRVDAQIKAKIENAMQNFRVDGKARPGKK